MYWLIESKDQIEVLKNSSYREAFIEIIPISHTLHPRENPISLVYLRPLQASKGYMLCINHSETLSLDLNEVNDIICKFDILYCKDKKEILHYFPKAALYDTHLPPNPYIQETTQTHQIYYNKLKKHQNVTNYIIPVVKHYEMCELIYGEIKERFKKENTKYEEFFNNKTSVVFNGLERGGLRVDKQKFEKHFHPIENDIIYTRYNLKTLTGRPSNSFKGVNYAGLNKENGCRAAFIPQNDVFWEIDISAYHPSLIAKMINYKFPTPDIHQYFADLYKTDYKKAKHITFQQIYGGIFEEYEDLEFFRKTKNHINNIYREYEEKGYTQVPISGYRINKKDHGEMKRQKLFNYILQALETAQNVLILWDIFRLLRGYNTKLVLYTYDSFLLDVDKSDTLLINQIRKVFKKYKLNIKEKYGYDYDFR